MKVLTSLILAMSLVISVRADNLYHYTLLNPQLPGLKLSGCAATDINDFGSIVGACNGDDNKEHGWLFDGKRYTEILLRRGDHTQLQGINNQNLITGWTQSIDIFGAPRLTSFTKHGGNVNAILAPGSVYTEAVGINDYGDVVGDFQDTSGRMNGFTFIDNQYAVVDVAAFETSLSDINNNGQVVGCYNLCGHGFTYDTRVKILTPIDIPGAVITQTRGVNDFGVIAGVYSFDGRTARGFTQSGIVVTAIDVPGAVHTIPFKINNEGSIVGYTVVNGQVQAFLATR